MTTLITGHKVWQPLWHSWNYFHLKKNLVAELELNMWQWLQPFFWAHDRQDTLLRFSSLLGGMWYFVTRQSSFWSRRTPDLHQTECVFTVRSISLCCFLHVWVFINKKVAALKKMQFAAMLSWVCRWIRLCWFFSWICRTKGENYSSQWFSISWVVWVWWIGLSVSSVHAHKRPTVTKGHSCDRTKAHKIYWPIWLDMYHKRTWAHTLSLVGIFTAGFHRTGTAAKCANMVIMASRFMGRHPFNYCKRCLRRLQYSSLSLTILLCPVERLLFASCSCFLWKAKNKTFWSACTVNTPFFSSTVCCEIWTQHAGRSVLLSNAAQDTKSHVQDTLPSDNSWRLVVCYSLVTWVSSNRWTDISLGGETRWECLQSHEAGTLGHVIRLLGIWPP